MQRNSNVILMIYRIFMFEKVDLKISIIIFVLISSNSDLDQLNVICFSLWFFVLRPFTTHRTGSQWLTTTDIKDKVSLREFKIKYQLTYPSYKRYNHPPLKSHVYCPHSVSRPVDRLFIAAEVEKIRSGIRSDYETPHASEMLRYRAACWGVQFNRYATGQTLGCLNH